MKTLSYKTILILISLGLPLSQTACKKYLEVKSDQKLAVPSKLGELQGLLNNYSVLSQTAGGAGEASSDNIYLTSEDWNALSQESERRLYTWQNDQVFAQDQSLNEWYCNYQAIYYANSVLKSLEKTPVNLDNKLSWNNIKGQALFFRGQYFLRTAIVWSVAYDAHTAQTDPGIPLRLNDDFNEVSVRSSVQETYNQILADLKQAVVLLQTKPSHPAHPSKPAAYGLLARTHLAMRKYKEAGLYADSCLELYNKLLDYNTLNPDDNYPIRQFNEEVILWNRILAPVYLTNTIAKIPADLYDSYDDNDLRKQIFFKVNPDQSISFKGYYDGLPAPFGGIATDEMLLIRAECAARSGDVVGARSDLNTLLKNRYKTGTYQPITENVAANLLAIILNHRRKELLLRDLRWMDLKRFNKEGANISLQRTMDGKSYNLKPNSPRYALPIPEDIIALSGMTQNTY